MSLDGKVVAEITSAVLSSPGGASGTRRCELKDSVRKGTGSADEAASQEGAAARSKSSTMHIDCNSAGVACVQVR